jgi:acetolactate synthase-1/3 small subunit
MTHVISLLVENRQGVLVRIAGLFSGRGYNLESLTVGPTTDPTVSRITLVCGGDEQIITQIKKQLNRLVDVIKVIDLANVPSVHREVLLIKIAAKNGQRSEFFQVADVFGAKIMDVGTDSVMAELTASTEKINDFIALLSEFQIIESARSGVVSLERGRKGRSGKTGSRVNGRMQTAAAKETVEQHAMHESV